MRLSLQSWHTSSLPESSSSLSLHFTCYPGFLSQTVCLANPVFHLVSTSVSFHLSTFLEDLHDLFLWHKLQPLPCFSPPKETSSCFCSSIDTTICLLVEPLSGIFFSFTLNFIRICTPYTLPVWFWGLLYLSIYVWIWRAHAPANSSAFTNRITGLLKDTISSSKPGLSSRLKASFSYKLDARKAEWSIGLMLN